MLRQISFISLCFLLLVMCSFVCAEQHENLLLTEESLSGQSIEDLLLLRARIDEALVSKGYTLYYDISHGDKGDHVARLQTRLKELNYYSGAVNGKYDTQTEKAVKQFQKANNLESSGIATSETQNRLFSLSTASSNTPVPRITPTPKPTLDPAFSDYEELDYTEAARYPEKYIGKKVVLKGKAIQVIGTKETGFIIRLALSGNTDIVYLTVERGLTYNILEDDRLIVYARMNGTKTYQSTFGQSITIPQAIADSVTLR